MKKRLLFIGFTHHQKTGSADFMIDLLRQEYETTICLIDLYEKSPYRSLQDYAGTYDLLVCWHVMPPIHLLNPFIRYEHATMFPMADACPSISKAEKWYPFRKFQIICFSRKIYSELTRAGFSAHYYQYFPKPSDISNWGRHDSAFFWFRYYKITCELVTRILESTQVRHLHIHNSPDPGEVFTPPATAGPIQHTYSTWYPDRMELQTKVCESAIYVAPRITEGIGMSFLEAMAMGRCVIAPNRTTMNEYIQHGVNGILYDPYKPRPLAHIDIRQLQKNAAESIRVGYAKWCSDIDGLMKLMTEPPKYSPPRIALRMIVRSIKNPVKMAKALRRNR